MWNNIENVLKVGKKSTIFYLQGYCPNLGEHKKITRVLNYVSMSCVAVNGNKKHIYVRIIIIDFPEPTRLNLQKLKMLLCSDCFWTGKDVK